MAEGRRREGANAEPPLPLLARSQCVNHSMHG